MSLSRHFAVPATLLAALVLGGCENEHPANVPGDAMVISEGNGVLTATATHAGTVYIYDVNGDRVVYSGAVASGQSVQVNTDQNKIMVDGQVRADRILNQWDKHRIYFDDTLPSDRQHTMMNDNSAPTPVAQP